VKTGRSEYKDLKKIMNAPFEPATNGAFNLLSKF
jgi:hypothetical protein